LIILGAYRVIRMMIVVGYIKTWSVILMTLESPFMINVL
jgi:hypothetical protein